MPEASLPPWLNVNPLQTVPFFLQGYSQGAQAGEAQRRAEQVAYDQSLHEAAQQERNEILREAKQIQAQEFAQTLKLKQDTAQRAAAEAAIQLEGQQGLEKDLQSGLSFQEAFPKWAPKLLYKHPQSLTEVMRNLEPRQNLYGAPTTVTLGGQEFGHIPGSATLTPIKQTTVPEGGIEAIPITNPDTGEVTYGRPGMQGTVIPLPRGESKTATMRSLRKEKRDLEKAKQNATLLGAETSSIDSDLAAVQAEMSQLATPTKKATEPNIETATAGTILPLPKKKEELVKGKIYQTPRGVALWDGEKFTTQ